MEMLDGDVFVVLKVWLLLLLMVTMSITEDNRMPLNKHGASYPSAKSNLPE